MSLPSHLVERMLGRGDLGVLVSMLTLGAALAIRDGRDPGFVSIEDIAGTPLSASFQALARRAHGRILEQLRRAPPDELDVAIEVARAHLRLAGYDVMYGRGN